MITITNQNSHTVSPLIQLENQQTDVENISEPIVYNPINRLFSVVEKFRSPITEEDIREAKENGIIKVFRKRSYLDMTEH